MKLKKELRPIKNCVVLFREDDSAIVTKFINNDFVNFKIQPAIEEIFYEGNKPEPIFDKLDIFCERKCCIKSHDRQKFYLGDNNFLSLMYYNGLIPVYKLVKKSMDLYRRNENHLIVLGDGSLNITFPILPQKKSPCLLCLLKRIIGIYNTKTYRSKNYLLITPNSVPIEMENLSRIINCATNDSAIGITNIIITSNNNSHIYPTLSLPDCKHCSEGKFDIDNPSFPSNILSNQLSGIMSDVKLTKSSFNFQNASTRITDTTVYSVHSKQMKINISNYSAGGVDENEDIAILKCYSEAIERYCAFYPCSYTFKKLSKDDVSFIKKITTFREVQYKNGFPYIDPIDLIGKQVSGLIANSAYNNLKRFIPEELIFLRPVSKLGRKPLDIRTSNGLAAGKTLEQAVLNGALEIIERDGLLKFWRLNKSLITFDLESDELVSRIKKLLVENNQSVEVYCTNGIAGLKVYIAVLTSKTYPYTSIGTSCGLNDRNCIKKAIYEAVMVRNTVNTYKSKTLNKANLNFSKTLEERALNVAEKGVEFNKEISEMKKIDTFEEVNFRKIKYGLLEDNRQLFYVDITTPDILPFNYKVVKVFIPGTIPLDFDDRYLHLGGDLSENNLEYLNLSSHPFC